LQQCQYRTTFHKSSKFNQKLKSDDLNAHIFHLNAYSLPIYAAVSKANQRGNEGNRGRKKELKKREKLRSDLLEHVSFTKQDSLKTHPVHQSFCESCSPRKTAATPKLLQQKPALAAPSLCVLKASCIELAASSIRPTSSAAH
jgi:hypothetical protein